MSAAALRALAARRGTAGIPSVCSAHPLVIEAAMAEAAAWDAPLLVEATCNQVNQQGGYTGMTPAAFRRFVEDIAARAGFPAGRLILGGDHLGPSPWTRLPAGEALGLAREMVAAYAEAGFAKLHLDCSMGCAGEPPALDDGLVAARAAALAEAAEVAAAGAGLPPPVYVIGTEVPVPGGVAGAAHAIEVTAPEAALATVAAHRAAFGRLGLDDAFARAVALVVQPGVEFGGEEVVAYDPPAARRLSAALDRLPGLVFEAHSTDYQAPSALAALVADGFSVLKVGPGLTFALREALYGLDAVAAARDGGPTALQPAMERLMQEKPGHWRAYYRGSEDEQRLQRHFSLSDRIRYYWSEPAAVAACEGLLARLGEREVPLPLIGQYLGALHAGVVAGEIDPRPLPLAIAAVRRALRPYFAACSGRG